MQIERNPDRKQIKHTNLTYQFYEWQIRRNSKISNKTHKLKKNIEKKTDQFYNKQIGTNSKISKIYTS